MHHGNGRESRGAKRLNWALASSHSVAEITVRAVAPDRDAAWVITYPLRLPSRGPRAYGRSFGGKLLF